MGEEAPEPDYIRPTARQSQGSSGGRASGMSLQRVGTTDSFASQARMSHRTSEDLLRQSSMMSRNSRYNGSGRQSSNLGDSMKARLLRMDTKRNSNDSQEFDKKPEWRRLCIAACRVIADHVAFVVITTVATMWALTGDDIRLLTTNKPADD